MRTTVKFEGGRELEAALSKLPASIGKPVLRRVSKAALKPVEDTARSLAPVADGQLRDSIVTSTRLTPRQAKAAKREGKSSIEMYTGTKNEAAVPQEFGTVNHAAQPFMRPAWDANKEGVLRHVGEQLGGEIEKAATRLAKKRAKAG